MNGSRIEDVSSNMHGIALLLAGVASRVIQLQCNFVTSDHLIVESVANYLSVYASATAVQALSFHSR